MRHRHRPRVAGRLVPLAAAVAALAALAALAPAVPAAAQGRTAAAAVDPPPAVLQAAPGDRRVYVPPPAPTGKAATATFQLNYAPGFPNAAKPAVQAAADVWAGLLTSSQTITVAVEYKALGATTLAATGPAIDHDFPGAPVANTNYPRPLAEALSGLNLGSTDVTMDINIRNDWYFGTDGATPGGEYDLEGVVMHELIHGLGFYGSMTVSGGQGGWGFGTPRPTVWDRFTETTNGGDLVNTSLYPNPSVALGNALTSGAVFFNSPRTNRGLGDRPRLYAPSPWEGGSSFSHLDEDTYPWGTANALATPQLHSAEAEHAPGPLALCMLEAMGWTTPEDCTPPASTAVNGFTWYSAGGYVDGGPSGTVIRAYATGAVAGRAYKLVSGLDGGLDRPCMWDTVPINPNLRTAGSSGFIPVTAGVLNRGPGTWQVCFREEGSGNTLAITAPATFQVS